ncbi:MAG: hypothetical protein DME91_09325 [Verrucomicrobia bacterium]|nr:MAG: hypothetical protein DME91_09325 [Verrucomicrobiota bacterium]
MDYGAFPYEEPYARPRRRINYFAWTAAILFLCGFALAAWLGSFYIFDQPERPDSYRILQRLHKIDPPKRFELTAAPAGEFLKAKELYDRYVGMGAAELAKTDAELTRNYIRNYQQVRGLVPYVIGRYRILAARELGPDDVFTSGMPGLEVKLERTHDLSAVIHAQRLADGRIMITAVPLLYGSYTVTRGLGTFRLEPPLSLNLVAGWPLFKAQERDTIEKREADRRQKIAIAQGSVPIPGLSASATPPPAQNELVRVEQARPVEAPTVAPAPPTQEAGKASRSRKGAKLAKKQKLESPAPASTAAQPVVAQKSAAPTSTPFAVASAPTVAAAQPTPIASPTPVPVLPAQPVPAETPGGALASNAGGGSWKTFPAGKMPLGRLIGTGDLRDVVEHGLAGERVYLRGQFVVNFSDANRAVLRPRTKLTDKVLHFGGGSSTRIIVEYPSGYTPPHQGSVVSRDELRPYEITEVRKDEDGQLNVFVREIMQP